MVIDRRRKPLPAGRCPTCGAPLQTTWYVDGRADLSCPNDDHQRTLNPAQARATELAARKDRKKGRA